MENNISAQGGKKALITGITGQDGAYLTELLLGKGYEVIGFSRSDQPDLSKLAYLGVADRVKVEKIDLLDLAAVKDMIKKHQPTEIYNLAGQSSVNVSFKEPLETVTYNMLSVQNQLEAIRLIDKSIKFYQATSCEIYSDKNKLPIREETQFYPSSPYGVSKVAAHMLVESYRDTFGLFAVSGILFNHESFLRKNYFMMNLIKTARAISNGADEYIYLGNADNKRDFGYAPEYVKAIWLMMQNQEPKDYLVCSGKSVSIREITEYVLKKFGVSSDRIKIDEKLFRKPNVPDLYGDNSRAKQELGWKYEMDFFQALDIMIEEEINYINNK
jgi:GDPmannose 4,6-dehydratase